MRQTAWWSCLAACKYYLIPFSLFKAPDDSRKLPISAAFLFELYSGHEDRDHQWPQPEPSW